MKYKHSKLAAAALAGLFAVGTASAASIVPAEKEKCSGKDGCDAKKKESSLSVPAEKEKCSGKKKDGDKEKCTGKDGCKGKDKKESSIL